MPMPGRSAVMATSGKQLRRLGSTAVVDGLIMLAFGAIGGVVFRALGLPLAWTSQTTLSVDDTAAIVAVLADRFPDLVGPEKEDICYATSNRQAAVKAITGRGAELVIVVGAPYSSNSVRLAEVARTAGARAVLVQEPDELDLDTLRGLATIGLTAGASAPESLVEAVIARLRGRFAVTVEQVTVAEERIEFRLPPALLRDRPAGKTEAAGPLASRTLAAD